MKTLQVSAVAIATLVASPAMAQGCSGTPLTVAQIVALVENNTVCGRPGPAYPGPPGDRFQEAHLAGGQLWDYKLGPGPSIDPRKQVGTWSTALGSKSSPDTITHQYSASLGFTWLMYGPQTNTPLSSTYSFCTTGASPVEHVRAYIVLGTSVPCTAYP
jgi:hypothetical protein